MDTLFERSRRPRQAALAVLLLLLAAAWPARAQLTTNTALQIGEGEGVLRLQARLLRATGSPGAPERALTVWAFPVVGVYGVDARLTLFGVVPVLFKDLEVSTPQGRRTRSTSGLGDVRLFARYTVLARDRRGQMIRLAPLAGLELPTGRHDDADDLGRLPRSLQPGSDSWDPFAGVVFTWQTFDWEFDLSATYTFFTEADAFRFGDQAQLDAAYKYRLLPRRLRGGVPGFLYATLETSLIRRDPNEIASMADAGSGGTSWYVVPGLQYVTKRYVLEAGVQLPLAQDFNGRGLENDFTAILSVRFNF